MEKQKAAALATEKRPPLSDEEQKKLEEDVVGETGGDERTPDQVQGQIKYAGGQTAKTEGGAGEPQTSKLEPEKQGGIGGP